MLAYAAHRPVAIDRDPHPNTMLLIIGVHVALIAAVMSARMEIQRRRPPDPPLIRIPLSPEPPPRPEALPQAQVPAPIAPAPDPAKPVIRAHSPDWPPPIANAGDLDHGSLAGGGVVVIPPVPRASVQADPTLPRLLTPAAELKPPYPAEKLLNEEEAVLTLKLAIDAQGRVSSVDPVGTADVVFLNAARRYLIAHWRYAPATRDGSAVPSTMLVTLHFELNG